MNFSELARDHNKHQHCVGCGGCIVDPAWRGTVPVWCVGCRNKVKTALPKGVKPPWGVDNMISKTMRRSDDGVVHVRSLRHGLYTHWESRCSVSARSFVASEVDHDATLTCLWCITETFIG